MSASVQKSTRLPPTRSKSIDSDVIESLEQNLSRLGLYDFASDSALVELSSTSVAEEDDVSRSPLESLANATLDLVQSIRNIDLTSEHVHRLVREPQTKKKLFSLARFKREKAAVVPTEASSSVVEFLKEGINSLLDKVSEDVNKLVTFSSEGNGDESHSSSVPTHWLLFECYSRMQVAHDEMLSPSEIGKSGENKLASRFRDLVRWITDVETRLSVQSTTSTDEQGSPTISEKKETSELPLDMGLFGKILPRRYFNVPNAPNLCALHDLVWWTTNNMTTPNEVEIGAIRSVELYRSKKAPFYHEYIVACFRKDEESPSNYVRVERGLRFGTSGPNILDPLSPVIGGVSSTTKASFSADKSELTANSNLLATLEVLFHTPSPSPLKNVVGTTSPPPSLEKKPDEDNSASASAPQCPDLKPPGDKSAPTPIYFGGFAYQIASTANSNSLYHLFTTNCRWFARRSFLDILQWTKLSNLPHSLSWKLKPISQDHLVKKLEAEQFGGSKINNDRGIGLNYRAALNLALSQRELKGEEVSENFYDPFIANLEGAMDFDPNERDVLLADLFTKRATLYLSRHELHRGLVDAEHATRLIRALPPTTYRRQEQLGWSLGLYGISLRLVGRYEESIEALEEAIRVGGGEAGEVTNQRRRILASSLLQVKRYEDAERVLVQVLKTVHRDRHIGSRNPADRRDVDDAVSNMQDRLAVLRQLSNVLMLAGKTSEAFQRLWEVVAIARDLQSTGEASIANVADALMNVIQYALEDDVNQWKEALDASNQVIELTKALPDQVEFYGLACSSKARALFEMGRAREAVEFQQLAITLLEKGESALTLANFYFRLGVYLRLGKENGASEAVEPTSKAVELLTDRYHSSDPSVRKETIPRLISVLEHLIDILTELLRAGQCLVAVEILVDVLRHLPPEDHERYQRDYKLADQLETLGSCYALLGRPQDGVDALRESASVLRSRFKMDSSEKARTMLQKTLILLSAILGTVGNSEEAMAALAEASSLIYDSDPVQPTRVQHFIRIATQAMECRDFDRALAAAALGSKLCRKAATIPRILVRTLVAEAEALEGLENSAEALSKQEEALSVFRSVHDDDSIEDILQLAQLLAKQELLLRQLGRYDDAIPVISRVVQIFRSLHQADPHNFERAQQLTSFVNELATAYVITKRWKEATPLWEERVAILKEVHDRDEDLVDDATLAEAYEMLILHNSSLVVKASKDSAEAPDDESETSYKDEEPHITEMRTKGLDAARQYLALHRSILASDPSLGPAYLERPLMWYAVRVKMLGDMQASMEAAVEVYMISGEMEQDDSPDADEATPS